MLGRAEAAKVLADGIVEAHERRAARFRGWTMIVLGLGIMLGLLDLLGGLPAAGVSFALFLAATYCYGTSRTSSACAVEAISWRSHVRSLLDAGGWQ